MMPARPSLKPPTLSWFDALSDAALIREQQIVAKGDNPAPLLQVSPSTWWRWVRAGKAPQPIKVSDGGGTFWRVGDMRKWLASLEVQQ